MKVRTETTIERPVDEVFAFISDPFNDPAWCPSVRSVVQAAGDGPGVGARYDVVHDPMGKPAELRYEILEFDPPTRMVMEQVDHLGTFVTTYELSAVGSATRLIQASDLRFKSYGRLIAPIVRHFVSKGTRDQFVRLKGLLEHDRDGETAPADR